jgi:hypothetical protein
MVKYFEIGMVVKKVKRKRLGEFYIEKQEAQAPVDPYQLFPAQLSPGTVIHRRSHLFRAISEECNYVAYMCAL